jgi:hypothetical protein
LLDEPDEESAMNPDHRIDRSAAFNVTSFAAFLLVAFLLAAGCSAPAPEGEQIAEGDAARPPASDAGTAPPTAPPEPPPPDRPPPEPTTGAGPTMCTQIGCSDGLNVELDGFDEELEVELTAGEETRTVTCLPPGPCRHFIPDFTPAEVTATALFGDREKERVFEPEYREERPNGPDCPPVCRQASIRWKL